MWSIFTRHCYYACRHLYVVTFSVTLLHKSGVPNAIPLNIHIPYIFVTPSQNIWLLCCFLIPAASDCPHLWFCQCDRHFVHSINTVYISSRILILRILRIFKKSRIFTDFQRRNEFYFFTLLTVDTSKYCIFTKCKLKLQWSLYRHSEANLCRLSAVKVGLLSQVHVNSCS